MILPCLATIECDNKGTIIHHNMICYHDDYHILSNMQVKIALLVPRSWTSKMMVGHGTDDKQCALLHTGVESDEHKISSIT